MKKTVGIRELKNGLSKYLRRVRRGDTIVITDRGTAVAEIVPPGTAGVDPSLPPGLIELAKKGAVRLGGRNHPGLYPLLPSVLPPGEAARLLDEERGDR